METKVIFSADDFGISPGVNQAICKAYHQGILNCASLMVNQKYANQALEMKKTMPNLGLGLHVNLTNEKPAAEGKDISLLVNRDGKFKHGFVNLLLLSLFKPRRLKEAVYLEVEAQIIKAKKLGVELSHIDSHRHVHMIPAIFSVFRQLMKKHDIPRMRVMNENIFATLKSNRNISFLVDGGLIKYVLLRFLSIVNGYQSKTYFYTILYTCKLSRERFRSVKIPASYSAVEIVIHPGMPDIDCKHMSDIFDDNILSPWRAVELETLLDKTVLTEICFDNKTI